MSTVQQKLIEKIVDALMAKVEEGEMKDAAALFRHAVWAAEIALAGRRN